MYSIHYTPKLRHELFILFVHPPGNTSVCLYKIQMTIDPRVEILSTKEVDQPILPVTPQAFTIKRQIFKSQMYYLSLIHIILNWMQFLHDKDYIGLPFLWPNNYSKKRIQRFINTENINWLQPKHNDVALWGSKPRHVVCLTPVHLFLLLFFCISIVWVTCVAHKLHR